MCVASRFSPLNLDVPFQTCEDISGFYMSLLLLLLLLFACLLFRPVVSSLIFHPFVCRLVYRILSECIYSYTYVMANKRRDSQQKSISLLLHQLSSALLKQTHMHTHLLEWCTNRRGSVYWFHEVDNLSPRVDILEYLTRNLQFFFLSFKLWDFNKENWK